MQFLNAIVIVHVMFAWYAEIICALFGTQMLAAC